MSLHTRLLALAMAGCVAITALTAPAASAADSPQLLSEDFSDGLTGWTAVGGGPVTGWSAESDADTSWIKIDNRTASSGSYIAPASGALTLPDGFEAAFQVRVDALGIAGNVSVVTGLPRTASRIQDGGTALQVTGAGAIRTQRPVTNTLCSGAAPVALGAMSTITVQRFGKIIRFLVDGQQVAAHSVAETGGTVAIGAYRAAASVSSVRVAPLGAAPTGFPTTAIGCRWAPPADSQPVMVNQSGYDLDMPKRFTAPLAEDGAVFTVVDESDAVVFEGAISGGTGDFSEFTPGDSGPFRVRVIGAAGTGTSWPFGIGASWTTRIATDKALRFMAGSLCWFGDFRQVGREQLRSEVSGPANCKKAVAWRDASQYGFELTTLADMLESSPHTVLGVPGQADLFTGAPHALPTDTPLVAQLLYWGAEVYVREAVNEPQLKGQLASFLAVYPLIERWIPRDTYERVRDYAFAAWSEPERDRFVWQAYTPAYDGNLLGLYTQVGTGKGELVPGHSIVPNLRMHEVAVREGREDASEFLNAALRQAAWIAETLDPADPRNTKGQRQSEWVTITSLVRAAIAHPNRMPSSVRTFVSEWADIAISRSDNLWDFRKYDDSGTSGDRWTIPPFTGGGQGEDPNEAGNVAGFAAPALAAATLLGPDDGRSERLRELAAAHIDNIFGRNPTGRAAQFRVTDPELAFEGLDRGWFSEYQGGFGILQGLPGVLDGSPKNGHYPYEPTMGNIGHTEGWVNVNTALNESLAWLASRQTDVTIDASSPGAVPGRPLQVEVRGPSASAGSTPFPPTATVVVGDLAPRVIGLEPAGDGIAHTSFRPTGGRMGDTVTVTIGSGQFARSATITLAPPG